MALSAAARQTKALPAEPEGKSHAVPTGPEQGVWRVIGLAGAATLTAVAALVPLFLVPFAWVPWFDLERAEAIVAKFLLLQGLSGLAICLGAAALLGPAWRRYRGVVLLPVAALLAYLCWGTLSLLANPLPLDGLVAWLPVLLTVGAALTGPMFLGSERRVRAMVTALLASSIIVAAIGIAGALGWRDFNRLAYGQDPRDVMENPELRDKVRLQGGARSAASISTMANPEYVGTYCAAVAAIGAAVLLDWTSRLRRRWLARALLLPTLGGLLILLAFSGTRQPWIALSLAGLLRFFLYLEVPKLPLALGFAAFLLTALLFGAVPGILFLGILLLVVVWWVRRRGDFLRRARASDRFNLTVAGLFPALLALLLVAYSVPGPWNPNGLRILQRFGTLLTQNDQSYRERALMYLLASEMVRENPALGVGPGRYGSRFTSTMADLAERDETGVVALVRERLGNSIGVHAHNDYLHTAAETGLPGLLLLLSAMVFLLGGLARVIRSEREWPSAVATAVLVGLVAFFSIMMTSFPLQMPERMSVFWMLVAAALGLVARYAEPPEDPGS